ncbi:MAG: phosphonate dehydrogenase [Thiohalocapsa sp.]
MKPKVVITHWVHPKVIELLEETCEIVPNDTRATLNPEQLRARARDASAIMVFMPDLVDRAFLEACPDLKIVAGALKGYDNLDGVACEERGIWLTNVPDLLTIPTAELTHGLMIALGRNILPSDRHLRSGSFRGWEPRFYGTGLDGSTVGIVGMGAVGRALAKRLLGYDSEVIYYDRRMLDAATASRLRVRYFNLTDLLRTSDFIACILPLNSDTLHLVNDAALAQMKPGAYLINTGRGSTVDENAVARALQQGQIAGYAADVYEFEDWARGDRPRNIPSALKNETARTILTTHIGSAVEATRLEIAMEAARNILQVMHGDPPQGAVNNPERD